MALWIHYTKNPYSFELFPDGGEQISQEYGLFVYKFLDDFPVEQRMREWAYRDPMIIKCPEKLVELVQTDPIGEDPSRDEYVIPHKHFDKCEYWRLSC